MKNKISYILFLFILFMSGCITEYNADVDEISNLLVVEGIITDDTTVIKLSKSVGLSEDIGNVSKVNNARVYVECDNGTTYQSTASIVDGTYKIPVAQLDPGLKYRLKIYIGSDEYESDYRSPLITPAIDSVNIKKRAQGLPVTAHVSTHDANNQSGYYIWTYTEIWETRSPVFALLYKDKDGVVREYDEASGPFNLGYYCWNEVKSNSLILGSTNAAIENRVIEHKLLEQPATDLRFSELYYLDVRQNMLKKDAYDYFSNLQKNIETTGNIFGPVPSEMKGNIACVTKPDEPVIGFVEVSTTTQATRFFLKPDVYEYPIRSDCLMIEEGGPIFPEDDPLFLPLWRSGMPPKVIYSQAHCVDCRLNGGTKNKPDFWPNNHR